MNFFDAVAQQPQWVRIWLDWLVFGLLVLPFALFFWPQSRKSAMAILLSHIPTVIAVAWLFGRLGYVKFLGFPHILFWTPVAVYLVSQLRRGKLPPWPRRITIVILATFIGTLAFDYTDSVRYVLGERTPTAAPSTT